MNSQLPHFRSLSTATQRAHLSPVTRTLKLRTVGRLAAVNDRRVPKSATPNPGTPETSSALGRIWTPNLLDRLQPPLTRYRE